jgi:hypothetical protein
MGVTNMTPGRERVLTIVALSAWVFATRLWLIKSAGSAVPFWDQWGAELIGLYRPWLDGTLRVADLFASHNEHRIVFTRVADLLLFELAGEWNPWNQLLLNAVLHAAAAGGLLALFWNSLAPLFRAGLVALLAVIFASPAGWQNALWGFQSQVYFGNVFTLLAIAGVCGAAPLSRRWWIGLAAAFLALFTNAGGLLASVSVLIVSAAQILATEDKRRQALAVALIGSIVVAGCLLRVRAPHHDPLQVHAVGQFVNVTLHSLAWPNVNHAACALLMQLPLLSLGVLIVRRRIPLTAVTWCAFALGLFALLQALAVAYSRGAGLTDDRPLSRYQDPMLLGIAAQAFASLVIASRHGLVGRLFAMAWAAALALGLVALTETNLAHNLPYKRAHDSASVANLQVYLDTHDAMALEQTHGLPETPENPAMMKALLDDARSVALLPPTLRPLAQQSRGRPPVIIAMARLYVMISAAVLLGITLVQLRAATPKRCHSSASPPDS